MNEKATPELRRAIGLPHATAMVVGIIIGASIFVQPSEITGQVPSVPGVGPLLEELFPEVEESARFLAGYRSFIFSYKNRTFSEHRVFPADPEVLQMFTFPLIEGDPKTALKDPKRVFRLLLTYLRRLYRKGGLVHADLSEYNIMVWRGRPMIFDVAQAVLIEHPMADRFLRRDLENLHKYFKRLESDVLPVEEMYKRVTGGRH